MTDAAISGLADRPGPLAAPRATGTTFTYAHPGQMRLRRGLICAVERIGGQPGLHRLYRNGQAGRQRQGETVFDAALRFRAATCVGGISPLALTRPLC